MLTDKEIEEAKKEVKYSLPEGGHHEHPDCVRAAYEWLDAQKKVKPHKRGGHAVKHLIENWFGRYVSTSDVDLAAHLHPKVEGKYPHFNLSSRLTLPNDRRLAGLQEANTQHQRDHLDHDIQWTYKEKEK